MRRRWIYTGTMPRETESSDSPSMPPPRAFTQGVGTVFQFVGVMLFLASMFVCCGSGLLSRQTATNAELSRIGWHLPGASRDEPPVFSAQRAVTLAVTCGVFFGVALACAGLGLQAQNRHAPAGAVALSALGTIFWGVQTVFAIDAMRSILFAAICLLLLVGFATMLGLSIASAREMRRNPPPPSMGVLPADYKIPYSHYHPDPPEVRLAAELEQRRQKLAVQQKELEMLEEKLRRKLNEGQH